MKVVRTRTWDFVFYGSALALWLTAHAAWSSEKKVAVYAPIQYQVQLASRGFNPLLFQSPVQAPTRAPASVQDLRRQ